MSTATDLAEYWNPVYNAFNPFQSIPPEKLDAWFVERPDTPLPVILTHFHRGHLPERLILVGHRSSGKSSELACLTAKLAHQDYDYFVVRIDLSRNLNVERVNQIEVLFLIGAAVYKLADEAKLHPDQQRLDALVESLNTLVRTHTGNKTFSLNVTSLLRGLICFAAGVAAGPTAAALAVGLSEVFQSFNFVSGTDTEIVQKVEVQPKISEILTHTNAILEDVAAKAGKPVALLVDGLDQVLNSEVTEMLFVRNRFLAGIACRVIYAVPVYVYYQPVFAPVRQAFQTVPFLNVPLRHHTDREKRDKDGYDVMRHVVNARLVSVGYTPDQAISPEAVDRLVSASGGLMRDLIRLVRDACVRAEIEGVNRIERETAQNVVAALRQEYDAQLTPRYRKVLDEVRRTQQRTEEPECDLLLVGNFILSYYSNRQLWYDVHSILW